MIVPWSTKASYWLPVGSRAIALLDLAVATVAQDYSCRCFPLPVWPMGPTVGSTRKEQDKEGLGYVV